MLVWRQIKHSVHCNDNNIDTYCNMCLWYMYRKNLLSFNENKRTTLFMSRHPQDLKGRDPSNIAVHFICCENKSIAGHSLPILKMGFWSPWAGTIFYIQYCLSMRSANASDLLSPRKGGWNSQGEEFMPSSTHPFQPAHGTTHHMILPPAQCRFCAFHVMGGGCWYLFLLDTVEPVCVQNQARLRPRKTIGGDAAPIYSLLWR